MLLFILGLGTGIAGSTIVAKAGGLTPFATLFARIKALFAPKPPMT